MRQSLEPLLWAVLPADGTGVSEGELMRRIGERAGDMDASVTAEAYIAARDRLLAQEAIARDAAGRIARCDRTGAGGTAQTETVASARTAVPGAAGAPGAIDVDAQTDTLVLALSGDWVIDHARALADQVERVRRRMAGWSRVRLSGEAVGRMDTSGAWILQKLRRSASAHAGAVETSGFRDHDFRLVEQISDIDAEGPQCEGVRCYTVADYLVRLGFGAQRGCIHLVEALTFLGRLAATATRCLGRPARMRLPAVIANMQRAGVNAIAIVALLSFLLAIVMAYQGATQLERFGAEVFTLKLTAVTMLREMGVLVTAILVAGRSGSAFAAEVGVMKVNEEIDAMQTMGLDPFEVLVLPRVMALVIMVPLLTLVADFAGLAGALLSVSLMLNVPVDAYLADLGANLTPLNFWTGMIKAPVFGLLIATTATFWGLKVAGSADSVGRLTTLSVVQSIFLVIAADAVFALVFIQLGI